MGEIGNKLYKKNPNTWKKKLKNLSLMDWNKKNKKWQNGIVVNGSVQLSRATQQEMVKQIELALMGK